MAFGSASFINSASTVYPLNALRRASASLSWPIEAQTSVLITCAPSAASSGTSVTMTQPPFLAASYLAMFGSNPSGHARRSSKPSTSAASSQALAMLLPSPIQAIPFPAADVLLHREQVGEHLAGVGQVGQPVDYGDRREAG